MLPKIIFTLLIVSTISIIPAFAESTSIIAPSLQTKVNDSFVYTSDGIEIGYVEADLDSISLIIQVSVTKTTGDMTVTFDRGIFDAKIGGEDDDFFIIADGEEIQFEEEKNEIERILSFSIPEGTEEVEIFGTSLFGESFLLAIEEARLAGIAAEEKAAEEAREWLYANQAKMDALMNAQNIEHEAALAEEAAKAEEARLALLEEACGDGTVFLDGECVNEELIGPQPEPIDSGPLINSIFAAMGIGLAVMIILWGIGKARHKKLSVVESSNS